MKWEGKIQFEINYISGGTEEYHENRRQDGESKSRPRD
jgi:hypothetical protein